MIDNNFSALLGKRLEKVTDVSSSTGISRTTLTQLYYKRGKSISYNVLEKLCKYFECQIGDFLVLKKE